MDPRLVDAQFRAYLDAVWVNRRTAKVLAADDIPPGIDRMRRADMFTRFSGWVSVLDVFDIHATMTTRCWCTF